MQTQLCNQLISETEQSFQKMGLDFYETMKRAPAFVEKWKRYAPFFKEVWNHASNREVLAAFLITGPDPSPEDMEACSHYESVLTLLKRAHIIKDRSLSFAERFPECR